jgi:apolipoprotein N-acyltransferase
MNLVRLLPVIFSFGLLAAHFSRANMFPLVLVSLALPFLLLIKRAWAARSIQVLLLLGAAEWIRSMFGYIEVRKTIGEDWTRLAIILGAVALLTACAGLVFRGKALKKRYELEKRSL